MNQSKSGDSIFYAVFIIFGRNFERSVVKVSGRNPNCVNFFVLLGDTAVFLLKGAVVPEGTN